MKYIILLTVATMLLLLLTGCSGSTPGNLGVRNGQLAPCPGSDNCVSSQATDDAHKIAPIPAHGLKEVVMVDLANTIESMFGGNVVELKGNYLRAEFTSRVWRFVDDLECYYDEANGEIQIRSASRLGYTDFNVNRERVEKLRALFAKRQ
ncbi:DUF1499 domain-containing protein [Pseudodesulfovibrio cashew]|uniref:DUF1499 domain-containing protein n=1 Tax=Pseudodesulfovibrio cashew TaxID=2678688 RepID=A0A6I6JJI0_9BACT|nr:DUF1499 domain-containing protein [Pseudodesulfovibrio cashew]QGY41118.1 DUF1499 domain-containing protein [Pseudodesulfovibrio cashew]